MKPRLITVLLCVIFARADGAENLQSIFATLQPKLASSPFGRPLVLESYEDEHNVRGDIYAIVNHAFPEVTGELDTPAEWCEVLILHLNVKSCFASSANEERLLNLVLGTKHSVRVDNGQRLTFRFTIVESSAEHFQVVMRADEGPLGTEDYRLSLTATPTPTDPEQAFLHLAYAYSFSTAARFAVNTYIHTLGKSKVGFTVTNYRTDGEPEYVAGIRGVLERNTMRYYLGIETYLASAAMPLQQRRRWRLSSWFDATERYARQLHELTKSEYLAGKVSVRDASVSGSAGPTDGN